MCDDRTDIFPRKHVWSKKGGTFGLRFIYLFIRTHLYGRSVHIGQPDLLVLEYYFNHAYVSLTWYVPDKLSVLLRASWKKEENPINLHWFRYLSLLLTHFFKNLIFFFFRKKTHTKYLHRYLYSTYLNLGRARSSVPEFGSFFPIIRTYVVSIASILISYKFRT